MRGFKPVRSWPPNISLQRTAPCGLAAELKSLAAPKGWLVALLISAVAARSLAKDIRSPMGFSLRVPDTWLVLSGAEVKANPDLLESTFSKLGPMDKSLLQTIRTQMESGLMEIYFSDKTYPDGRATVNVIKLIEAVPTTPADVEAMCKTFPANAERAYRRPITMNSCGARKVAERPGLYMEYTGLKTGWFTVSYLIALSPSIEVTVTGTFPLASHRESLKEFDRVVQSISFTDGG